MSERMRKWQMLLLGCLMVPMMGWGVSFASWDASSDSGLQNINGTWGVDNFWSFNGVDLQAWDPAWGSWFGGRADVPATPDGDFTVTVSGTQTSAQVRQIVGGAGNYTLADGTLLLAAGGIRADYGTFTVNSVVDGSASTLQLNTALASAVIILGGNNIYTAQTEIRGVGGGIIRMNNAGAFGAGSSVKYVNSSVTLDMNGFNESKDIIVNLNQTGFLGNSALTPSVWSGNVNVSSSALRAGGTEGELEISGVISGTTVQVMDGTTLRLSGANVYTGNAVVRDGGTLIVDNAAALGSTSGITYVQDYSTLDLNGFDIGLEEINLQKAYSRLVNEAAGAAAAGGPVTVSAGGIEIGGSGDLTLSGAISGAGWFTKVGTGTVTFSGTNSYLGDTFIAEGTLAGGNEAFVGCTEIQVAEGAGLTLQDAAALNADTMLRLNSSSALTLDFSGTQTVAGISLDNGVSWLTGGTYDAAQLSALNSSGTYSGSGSIVVSGTPSSPVEVLPGGAGLVVSWVSTNGVSYSVESRSNLLTGAWEPVATNLGGSGSWLHYTGTVNDVSHFYRIIEE